MKTDYPELEGKEVLYNNAGDIVKAKVSGCNYHVGISIEDLNGYLLCLNGKSSPIYKKFYDHLPQYLYRKIFHLIVKQIKEGKVNAQAITEMTSLTRQRRPTVNDCPFAQ